MEKIETDSPVVQYIGNGAATRFAFKRMCWKESDILVYFDTTLQATGYSLEYDDLSSGAVVVFNEAPPNGVLVTIVRTVRIERMSEFEESSTFRASVINDELNHIIASLLQLQEQMSRAILTDITGEVDPEVLREQIRRIHESTNNIDKVADNITKVTTTANNITNINTVAGSISNVNATGKSISNVNTVATNINSVNLCAANINAIIDAPNQATIAKNSATNATNQAAAAKGYAQSALRDAAEIRETLELLSYAEVIGGYAGDSTSDEIFGGSAGDGVNDEIIGGNY